MAREHFQLAARRVFLIDCSPNAREFRWSLGISEVGLCMAPHPEGLRTTSRSCDTRKTALHLCVTVGFHLRRFPALFIVGRRPREAQLLLATRVHRAPCGRYQMERCKPVHGCPIYIGGMGSASLPWISRSSLAKFWPQNGTRPPISARLYSRVVAGGRKENRRFAPVISHRPNCLNFFDYAIAMRCTS